MMQHYALRAPDRDALIRIDADLRQLDLLPHSLTFEVLIHAYGAIAPVDKDTMWDVIELLEKNETIHAQVKGYHWAGVMKCLGADGSSEFSFCPSGSRRAWLTLCPYL